MLAPITHILPITTIRRERLLTAPGKVVVRKGQKVNATDTVAEAVLTPEHILLDVARGLGVPAAQADQHIQVQAGSAVAEGDVIAGPVGFARRVVRAPRDGRVVLAGEGQVLIEVRGQPFALKAGLPGEVADLYPDRGVVVQTTGALIQGVWGNGPIDAGLLVVLATTPGATLTHDLLDVSQRGSIILAGYCGEADALRMAADLPLRGLILSSLEPALVDLAATLALPVIVLEGFGKHPMNSAAFKLLSTNERREVAINAEPWDVFAGTRPEIVIPLPAPGNQLAPRETDSFAAGQQVRVVRPPHFGVMGQILSLAGPAVLPNGLRAQAAQVKLENGQEVTLPLANLQVIE